MKIKKLLSFAAACAMAITPFTAFAEEEIPNDGVFNYNSLSSEGYYTIFGYLGETTEDVEVELPKYFNGYPVYAGKFAATKAIKFSAMTYPDVPEFYNSIYEITACNSTVRSKNTTLKTVKVDYTGEINLSIKYATVIENVYLSCSSLNTVTLSGNNAECIYHVANENVKNTLVSAGILEDKVLVDLLGIDKTALNEALSNAGNYQEVAYTADSYKALTDAVTAGNAVLSNKDATQTDVDNATKAINDAITGLKFAGYTVLETLIGQADDIVNNHADEYVSLINLNSVLSGAKPVLETAKSSEMTEELQAQVNDYAQRVKEQIDALEKVDIPAELKKLQTVIENAEALSASEYTEDSYKVLTDAINEAKKITESSPYSEIISAKTAVTNAVNKLVSKPLDPIGYIRHGWTDKAFVSGTTSEEMAGATQIKLTFDCASDTSYNQYFNTPIEAKIGSTVTNFEMKGTAAAENLGEKNCTATMTLTAPVEAGQNYTLTGYTYGYANAKDYVFAMTKVEFLDESGKVLGKVTAKTIAQNKLAEAIAKAEEIKADDYTAESVKVLTDAIEAAKALTDEATAEEINTAITAIDEAIKGLAKKPTPIKTDPLKSDPTKQDPSKPNTTNPTTKTPTKPTRSKDAVKKDKSAAKKAMKQAKISKLKVKSKAKKKINVSWKKVKKAKGYQVQVSAKKNFKKVIFKKDLKKTKLNIKNKKIKSKKTYYVRVRAYATYKDANNKTVKVYSKWNKKLRKVKVK